MVLDTHKKIYVLTTPKAVRTWGWPVLTKIYTTDYVNQAETRLVHNQDWITSITSLVRLGMLRYCKQHAQNNSHQGPTHNQHKTQSSRLQYCRYAYRLPSGTATLATRKPYQQPRHCPVAHRVS